IAEEKIRVIGNGADINRFYPTDREEARKRLRLPISGRLVVSVGSLTEHKGHSGLIAAFGKLLRRWPDLRLAIVGQGPLRSRLERQIAEEHLEDRVLLPGACLNEELSSWYNAADISCLPSSREGWPNVLLESLACGTPVVATRIGGVPEVITS